MSIIQVRGLQPLSGEIKIQGSKNAVLPIMAASILHKGITILTNVPLIQDVSCMMGILEYLGCVCTINGHTLKIDATNLSMTQIPDDKVKEMRSSIVLLGALLGRSKDALTYYPGGCSIGERPIDLHLYALECMGAKIREEDERIEAVTAGLVGGDIRFAIPSVGATENALLGAVAARGTTTITGAAKEPEIEELCKFLVAMGAEISGIGTGRLTVHGGKALHDVEYEICGDRIVAGTYLGAVMAAGGTVKLLNVPVHHLEAALTVFEEMGASIVRTSDSLEITCNKTLKECHISTAPYPEFPTDLQSIVMAVMAATADYYGTVRENVFEARLETAHELNKLGADVVTDKNLAIIKGVYPLTGARVTARDLRGGAALVIAGLAAEGITEIDKCHYIERGYEDICRDLRQLGAKIEYQA